MFYAKRDRKPQHNTAHAAVPSVMAGPDGHYNRPKDLVNHHSVAALPHAGFGCVFLEDFLFPIVRGSRKFSKVLREHRSVSSPGLTDDDKWRFGARGAHTQQQRRGSYAHKLKPFASICPTRARFQD